MSKKELNEMELDLDFELGVELGEEEEAQLVGGKNPYYSHSSDCYTNGSGGHSYSDYCA